MARSVLRVWLPLPLGGFDFLSPPDEGQPPRLGARIAVPWQGGTRVGWLAGVEAATPATAIDLSPAIAVLDGPRLGPAVRAMLLERAIRCAVPIGVALGAAAAPLRGPFRHEVRLRDASEGSADLALLADGAWHLAERVPELARLRERGAVLERLTDEVPRVRRLVALRPADAGLAGTPRAAQRSALALLAEGAREGAADLARAAAVPVSAARALIAKGYAGYEDAPIAPPPVPWATPDASAPSAGADARDAVTAPPPTPAPGHDRARTALTASDRALLVSGGTAAERFGLVVAWLAEAATEGQQALLLVPEQALADRFARAAARVAPTLRVGGDLTEGARAVAAAELARGTAALVVGTPAALVLDLPRLARLAVWDAAAPAYKEISGARSVARADALALARAADAAWLLVDPLATAELRAAPAERHLALPRPPQRTALIDLRRETLWPLSAPLVRLLRQVQERGRQALLLVARRGYAAAVACRSCGAVVMCPHCDVPWRYHQRANRLLCHRCGTASPMIDACPTCAEPALAPRPGAGTEWVAETVSRLVPGLPIVRFDRDLRGDVGSLVAGGSGALIGTVAALRLPPLPNLSLVAVTAGDALHDHEDLRADETALRTLLALPDLAAAGKRPLLVAQVMRPEHPLWQAWSAADQDAAIDAFEATVDARRAAFGYPPARVWARVQVSHRDAARAGAGATAVTERLALAGVPREDLLGPAPAPVARIAGRYAFHTFVRAADAAQLADRLALLDRRPGDGVAVRVDVDPYDIETPLD